MYITDMKPVKKSKRQALLAYKETPNLKTVTASAKLNAPHGAAPTISGSSSARVFKQSQRAVTSEACLTGSKKPSTLQ